MKRLIAWLGGTSREAEAAMARAALFVDRRTLLSFAVRFNRILEHEGQRMLRALADFERAYRKAGVWD